VQAWGTGLAIVCCDPIRLSWARAWRVWRATRPTFLVMFCKWSRVLQATGTSLDYSVLMPIDAVRALSRTIRYLARSWLGQGKRSC